MRPIRSILHGVPPVLVGVCVAGAAEMSAGLLLYSTEGFLPALTLILTVETGAVALGLWSGSFPLGEGPVEQVRRRWLFSLVAFAVAAAFSTGMTFTDGLLNGGVGQGLGLALLGSLPLFSLGSLLGAMAGAEGGRKPPTVTVGVPAVVGLALGFLVTGGVLLPNMAPYTLYLVCLTALSGGALLHGRVLENLPSSRILGQSWTDRGEVRLEEQRDGGNGGPYRLLFENDRLRGGEDLDGEPARAWERAVLSALERVPPEAGAILHLGGGSGTMVRILSREVMGIRNVVVEGSDALVTLAREHLHPFPGWSEVELLIGDPWPLVTGLEGRYSLVLFDSGLAPALGSLPHVPEEVWEKLSLLIGPRGRLVVGEIGGAGLPGSIALGAFMERISGFFGGVSFYQGDAGGFFLMSSQGAPPWPTTLRGFQVPASGEG